MPSKKSSTVLTLPQHAGDIQRFGQLIGSSGAYFVANLIQQHSGLTVFITTDMQQSLRFIDEIKSFTQKPIHVLADWETLPYDNFSPQMDIVSDRLACLYQLPHMTDGALILPINTLMQKVCPHDYIMGHVFLMKKGMSISRETLRLQLENAGYRAVDQVMEHGEFATRGALFDLFPMGSDVPFRLDFFDDEIDSIRTFDVDTQRTLNEIDQINLLPAHEFPTDKSAIETFRMQWRERFDVRREAESVYQQISKGVIPTGIEYWQPLFFTTPLSSLFDYLPESALIVNMEPLENAASHFWDDVEQRYESRRHDTLRPILPPSQMWLRVDELFASLKNYPRVTVSTDILPKKAGQHNLEIQPLPDITAQTQTKTPLLSLEQFSAQFDGSLIFVVETEGRRETLDNLLKRIKIKPKLIKTPADITQSGIYVLLGSLEKGFIDTQRQQAWIGENDLHGQYIPRLRPKDGRRTINTDNLIRSLMELQPGQPVVHLDHGVGRYAGLTTLETGAIKAEYMVLHYANDAKLYVPVSSLNMISRYLGGSEENAPLHKLGNDSWGKARQKAAESARDVAAELLDIYAQRAAKTGVQFTLDADLYAQFCESFPYELTPDQQQAVNGVLQDMCSGAAMDRLVCGDVGFGKTEVAIRAAFLAAMNHKQVAVLVPTTLLAQQHFDNFVDRFAGWPIRIEMVSRFRTAKEQKLILAEVAEGKIDILVGTHKLLQNDIHWHDLGLLIVDEEHRFGVRQKERVKAMRANVDILTLTATPIPRTLNMAMNGMRDLSIIATPPARRLAVKTFVRESDDLVTREAILREVLRGGQVYYLFNDVERIEHTAERLQKLVPEARIAIGHGQMNERALERVMNDFHHQRFNVLVCTTIIETGIDIPSANTIIIERADKFGLAQLHQLRGRVGRSHHQAYAYLLTPPPKLLSSDAKKRLDAIASLEDLGAGFALATHDLEIRGAGELLGDDQSGQITTIGFNLYMELLEHAVETLKSGKSPSLDELLRHEQTEVELRLPVLIPDEFVSDVNTRLSFYKRIASANDDVELNELRVELIDRYGLLPDSVKFLFAATSLKLKAKSLGIKRIELHEKGGFIEFNPNHAISIDYLISLIQNNPKQYRLDGENRLKLIGSFPERMSRITFIEHLLNEFSPYTIENKSK